MNSNSKSSNYMTISSFYSTIRLKRKLNEMNFIVHILLDCLMLTVYMYSPSVSFTKGRYLVDDAIIIYVWRVFKIMIDINNNSCYTGCGSRWFTEVPCNTIVPAPPEPPMNIIQWNWIGWMARRNGIHIEHMLNVESRHQMINF